MRCRVAPVGHILTTARPYPDRWAGMSWQQRQWMCRRYCCDSGCSASDSLGAVDIHGGIGVRERPKVPGRGVEVGGGERGVEGSCGPWMEPPSHQRRKSLGTTAGCCGGRHPAWPARPARQLAAISAAAGETMRVRDYVSRWTAGGKNQFD